MSLLISDNGRAYKSINHTNKEIESFVGYNIYQSIDGGEFEFLVFLPPGYTFPASADGKTHCYQITEKQNILLELD